MTLDEGTAAALAGRFGVRVRGVEVLDVAVNDVARVQADEGAFALKLYHAGRTPAQVAWEVDLALHLAAAGVPVAAPVAGPEGRLVSAVLDGRSRCAVLWQWVDAPKPSPSHATYVRLGELAATIHAAADGVPGSPERETYDLRSLVDEQLDRMRPFLAEAGEWERTVALGERMSARLRDRRLDEGVCHADLTLDNVLERNGGLTAVDFDSAGWSSRAMEPWGVLRYSEAYFRSWLAGYRSVRSFSAADEAAVAVFGVVADLRNVAWKLGVADSSSGPPLLRASDLPAVVAGWLEWERHHPG